VQLGETVAEVARLLRASRGARGGVEVHDDLASAIVRQRHLVAVGIGKGEIGCGITGGESAVLGHGGDSSGPCSHCRRASITVVAAHCSDLLEDTWLGTPRTSSGR